MEDDFKLPRLYVPQDLVEGVPVILDAGQAHYLGAVLRRKIGDMIRVFNGKDGEWLVSLEEIGKKSATGYLKKSLRVQPAGGLRVHLLFAPIKKHRMDWLVEKAVELGVTDLHPVLTRNTEVRKINVERLERQVFEAAEQCERLEIPVLHSLRDMQAVLQGRDMEGPVLACVERFDAVPLVQAVPEGHQDLAVLIGPEGGFTAEEKTMLAGFAGVTPVSLGDSVLRCETAAVKALILATEAAVPPISRSRRIPE